MPGVWARSALKTERLGGLKVDDSFMLVGNWGWRLMMMMMKIK